MNKNYPTPEPVIILENLETLKVVTDPLRNQILETLTPAPQTVGQIATKLGLETSRLYYHFNLLEKHGFIQVVDTSVQGNLIEKTYWLTAYRFEVDPEAFNFNVDTLEGTESIIALLLANINATREDLQRSIYARHEQIAQGAPKNPRHVLDTREVFYLPDDKAAEFHARLNALVEEFKHEQASLPADGLEVLPWALSVIFYPSFHYQSQE
jgi:DNA-binding transcriptional ArsR family regulator